jgi:hypothetical protein
MRSSDCAVKLCSRRDRTSLSRSCVLLNGVKPLIQGLDKAMLPDTGRATICLEGCSRLPIQANSLIRQTSAFVGTRAIPSLNSIRLDECIGDLASIEMAGLLPNSRRSGSWRMFERRTALRTQIASNAQIGCHTANCATAGSFQLTPVPAAASTIAMPCSTRSGSASMGFHQSAYSR